MSDNSSVAEEGGTALSKKAAKKEAMKQEKLKRQQDAAEAAAAAFAATSIKEEDDPLSGSYGEIPLQDLQSKIVSGRIWTEIGLVGEALKDKTVLIRGQIHTARKVSKNTVFLDLREKVCTIQCVVTVEDNLVSQQMVKFAKSLTKESVVDIEGIVTVPAAPITGATQQVELKVRKLYCISKALPKLPFNIDDAARSEADVVKALQAGEQLARVTQDTRLNFRVLDLRTPANQAIFSIQDEVETAFTQHLKSIGFRRIHTPKLIAGSSEGGASVFKLDYVNGHPACLAQSPQLHKQMSVCGGLPRVFEVGPVFRAEKSDTHRHLCEYIGLDMEMVIKEHYSEVMDVLDSTFVQMFHSLNENCKEELETIGKQYPFEPIKYLRKTLRLTYEEGVQMLKEAGVEVKPLSDLNTEMERKLGKLVAEKYGTDFFILHRYPLAVRPFYTMPAYDNPEYSNSFDVFLRGEEIISGAQRIHDPVFLCARANALGIDLNSIEAYINAFRYGTHLHGGFGVGLERVVMLFCGLDNIRKTSLFPRDPQRLTP